MLLKRSTDDKYFNYKQAVKKDFKVERVKRLNLYGLDGMSWALDSSLYLTDGPYVRKVTMDGVVSTISEKLTTESMGEDLMGLTASSTGDLFIADYSGRRILKINIEGKIETVLQSGIVWSPTGIAVVGQELYVFEHLRMPLVVLGNIGIGPYIRIRNVTANCTNYLLYIRFGAKTHICF